MAAAAEYQALEYGQAGAPTPWDNPQTQHRGQIVPGKPYPQGEPILPALYPHDLYRRPAADGARHGLPPA